MSKVTSLIFRSLIVVVLISAIGGLLGWYFFLHSRTSDTQAEDVGRGLGDSVPSFTGSIGNTFQNVLSSITGSEPPQPKASGGAVSQLWHVTLNPVAGADFVQTREGERLYFVERATGNVFSANTHTGLIERLTNTLMPKIYEAAFTTDGAIVQRSIDPKGRATTFIGTITLAPPSPDDEATSTLGSLEGSFLNPGVTTYAINPKKREYFYIMNDAERGAIGIKSAWDGSGQKRLFQSGLTQWRAQWLSDGRIIVTQKAADNVPGYSYSVSAGSSPAPVLRDIPGLTILPKASSQTILYGTSAGGSLALFSKTGSDDPLSLPLKTFADKCVWLPDTAKSATPMKAAGTTSKKSPAVVMVPVAYCAVPQTLGVGDFLNNWYAGRIHTADNWWRINAADGTTQMLYPLDGVDVVDPAINDDGTMITFRDRNDGSLWLLQLPFKEPTKQTATSASSTL